jgi:site-specific DNA recombinase
MKRMTKAALYARVSTDAQQKEGTIDSQVAELRRQIAAAGHVLVKEYIDDGYSGAEMDRPALEQLRKDLKGDTFDAIYFLCADRIAREASYQNIIISEFVKHRKQIIISGKDYVADPENKFTLTVFGAMAEFERDKIIERTTRGRLHRLRKGELMSAGSSIYGYHYVKKTPTSSAALVVNEVQAAVVRSVFERFASGECGLNALCRSLEAQGVPTRAGGRLWKTNILRSMLKNHTYTGTRYFNRIAVVYEPAKDGKRGKRRTLVQRDRSEWIAVKVPAIISQELYDKAQERLRLNQSRYRQPAKHYVLHKLIQCGECGWGYSSYRRYQKVVHASGKVTVYHEAAYRCNRRAQEGMHDRMQIKRCGNSRVGTQILEDTVFTMIQEVMLDPGKLRGCVGEVAELDERGNAAAALARIAQELKTLDENRQRMIERYVTEQMAGADYINESRALDEELYRLTREKVGIVKGMRVPQHDDFVDASIRQFCANAKARFEACTDFDTKRRFLVDHIERVIYDRSTVRIVGSVPVASIAAEQTKLQFRIEGQIGNAISRGKTRRVPEAAGLNTWLTAGRASLQSQAI